MSDETLSRHSSGRTLVRGAPFSQIVCDDRYAFVAGVVAADLPGGEAALGDVAAETRLVMDAIGDLLAEIGLGFDRVVRVDLHLADFGEFARMNEVYRRYFEDGRYPARTATESRRLFGGSRVEITCVARRRAPTSSP